MTSPAQRQDESHEQPASPGPVPPCLDPSELALAANAVVVDVRSDEEFAAGHVEGALHIPLAELAARASEIPKGATVVTACGKGGGRSDRAALELRALGFPTARPLCGGTMAWLALEGRGAR